jgi:hypothetical protein
MTDISPASKFGAKKCRAALDELRLTCLITRTSKRSEVNPANSDRVARKPLSTWTERGSDRMGQQAPAASRRLRDDTK